MVHVYGVTHGGRVDNFLLGTSSPLHIFPTDGLIEDLKERFPAATRVGVEDLSEEDWREVKSHLASLPFDPHIPHVSDQEYPTPRPFYGDDNRFYWKRLEEVCRGLGLEVVFLEDKNIWFRYNEAIIKAAENDAMRRKLLFKKKGESDEAYDRKRIGFNIARHQEGILARKIHEIERDTHLLRLIRPLDLKAVFVGFGHSDYWMVTPGVGSEFGIEWDGYSTETPRQNTEDSPQSQTVFVKEAYPNFRNAFERTSLERSIRLLETGRLSERKPDLVGTWDISNPPRGYFEMFITRDGSKIRGEITDCLGDADFEGNHAAGVLRFVKQYRSDFCSGGASLKKIAYEGIVRGGEVTGYFVIDGCGEAFCAAPMMADFLDMGMSWYYNNKRCKQGMDTLRKRLFGSKLPR